MSTGGFSWVGLSLKPESLTMATAHKPGILSHSLTRTAGPLPGKTCVEAALIQKRPRSVNTDSPQPTGWGFTTVAQEEELETELKFSKSPTLLTWQVLRAGGQSVTNSSVDLCINLLGRP